MSQGSKKAVVTAIVANAVVTVLKFLTAFAGGSPSMMNEALHSLIDTLHQGGLFFGLAKAAQPADKSHPLGHVQRKQQWNLWGAIGLFSIGSALGLAYAWHAWRGMELANAPALVEVLGVFFDPLGLALLVLCLAFIIKGYSFVVALKAFLAAMRKDGSSSPFIYLVESKDSTLIAVVLEDSVAMLGLVFAIAGIGLTAVTGNALWDIGSSVLIALMLGGIAFYLGMLK